MCERTRGCRVWQRDTPVDVLLLGIRLGFVSKNNKKRFCVQTKPQKSRKTDGIPTIRFAGAAHLQANATAPCFGRLSPGVKEHNRACAMKMCRVEKAYQGAE